MAPRKLPRRKPFKLERRGFTLATFESRDIPDYVVAELRYESPVAYTSSKFAAPAAAASQADR